MSESAAPAKDLVGSKVIVLASSSDKPIWKDDWMQGSRQLYPKFEPIDQKKLQETTIKGWSKINFIFWHDSILNRMGEITKGKETIVEGFKQKRNELQKSASCLLCDFKHLLSLHHSTQRNPSTTHTDHDAKEAEMLDKLDKYWEKYDKAQEDLKALESIIELFKTKVVQKCEDLTTLVANATPEVRKNVSNLQFVYQVNKVKDYCQTKGEFVVLSPEQVAELLRRIPDIEARFEEAANSAKSLAQNNLSLSEDLDVSIREALVKVLKDFSDNLESVKNTLNHMVDTTREFFIDDGKRNIDDLLTRFFKKQINQLQNPNQHPESTSPGSEAATILSHQAFQGFNKYIILVEDIPGKEIPDLETLWSGDFEDPGQPGIVKKMRLLFNRKAATHSELQLEGLKTLEGVYQQSAKTLESTQVYISKLKTMTDNLQKKAEEEKERAQNRGINKPNKQLDENIYAALEGDNFSKGVVDQGAFFLTSLAIGGRNIYQAKKDIEKKLNKHDSLVNNTKARYDLPEPKAEDPVSLGFKRMTETTLKMFLVLYPAAQVAIVESIVQMSRAVSTLRNDDGVNLMLKWEESVINLQEIHGQLMQNVRQEKQKICLSWIFQQYPDLKEQVARFQNENTVGIPLIEKCRCEESIFEIWFSETDDGQFNQQVITEDEQGSLGLFERCMVHVGEQRYLPKYLNIEGGKIGSLIYHLTLKCKHRFGPFAPGQNAFGGQENVENPPGPNLFCSIALNPKPRLHDPTANDPNQPQAQTSNDAKDEKDLDKKFQELFKESIVCPEEKELIYSSQFCHGCGMPGECIWYHLDNTLLGTVQFEQDFRVLCVATKDAQLFRCKSPDCPHTFRLTDMEFSCRHHRDEALKYKFDAPNPQ